MSKGNEFKIIIAGGGVAGLTLANMLEKFNIDYVILEAHGDIAPPAGASIGLFPNGLLVLDQLGCYDAVRGVALQNTAQRSHTRASDGKPITTIECTFEHLEKR
jgi:2-polyprenyl-6-methoxyphenol hydroxylase-like FAD-dependent oxidoreductase